MPGTQRHPSVLGFVGSSVCLVVVSATSCQKPTSEPATASEQALQLGSRPARLPSSTKALREQLDTRYRLGPDRRLLLAISDVHALLTSQPWKETRARWLGDRFALERDGVELGRLSELADFSESYALLTGVARHELDTSSLTFESSEPATVVPRPRHQAARSGPRGKPKARPPVEDEPLLLEQDAVATVERVEKAWHEGHRSTADLQAAALALSSLSFQALDTMELGDRLTARALAVVALARAVGGPAPTRAEVLVARALDYELPAARLAKSLPTDDSLRAFVQQDEETLRLRSLAPTASAATQYLWSRWVADAQVDHRRREGETTDLPSLANRLRSRGFHDELDVALLVSTLAQAEAARDAGDGRVGEWLVALRRARTERDRMAGYRRIAKGLGQPKGLFTRLEASLDGLPDGLLLSRAARQDYFLALLYSALDVMGHRLLDERSMPELAGGWVAELGSAATPRARELKRWLETLAQARSGHATEQLLDELETMTTLGSAPRARVLDELSKVADWGDPQFPPLVQRLAQGLDARPTHRLRLGEATRLGLRDLRLADRFTRSGLESLRSPSHEIQQAGDSGDWATLKQLAQAPHLTAQERAQSVDSLLQHHQVTRDEARRKLRDLLDPKGNDWVLRRRLVELLEADGRYAEARGLVIEWLNRKLPESLERVTAQTALAREYWLDQDLDNAWATVAPLVAGWQFETVRTAARILAAQGKAAEAEEMGRRLTKRYPGPKSDAVLCEVYWREGRQTDAAAVLSGSSRMIRLTDWGFIGEAFAAAFAGRPDADALAAMEALQRTALDAFSLSQLATSVAAGGRHRLAFELLSRLKDPGPGQLELSVAAYLELKLASDEATARAWLETAVPSESRAALSTIAMKTKAYELLWTLVPTPDRHDDAADFVWLARATGALDRAEGDREALRRHFERTGDSHSHVLGRYLLGLEDETAVLRLVGTEATKTCEVAFYLGMKAESERHLEEASDWYHAALETGLAGDHEYRLAADRLSAWYATGKSLARLATEQPQARGG